MVRASSKLYQPLKVAVCCCSFGFLAASMQGATGTAACSPGSPQWALRLKAWLHSRGGTGMVPGLQHGSKMQCRTGLPSNFSKERAERKFRLPTKFGAESAGLRE